MIEASWDFGCLAGHGLYDLSRLGLDALLVRSCMTEADWNLDVLLARGCMTEAE
jgi:hypothetical protein